jgi:hypothetical protein
VLAAPWALLALLAIPVLVWIHRRRRLGVPVDVPSLLFLEEESLEATAPERRRFDAELALSIAAALCLALAAAGPSVAVGGPKPVVRVVLDASPAMDARATPASKSPREQAEAAIAALGLSDVVVRARGKPADLLAAARREPADVRIVVSDRAITPAPSDVHVAAYGDPAAENVGIVAVHLASAGPERLTGHAVVWNHSRNARVVRLGEQELEVPADSARSGTFSVASRTPVGSIAISTGAADAYPIDDVVGLDRTPLRVSLSDRLPARHRDAVEQVLRTVSGEHGYETTVRSPDLVIDTTDSPVTVTSGSILIEILRAGEAAVAVDPRPAAGIDPVLAGVDASGAECLGSKRGPLVYEAGLESSHKSFAYAWAADPLAGSPAPVDTPAWPVFWANLLSTLRGDDVGGGWRARGVLDPDVTRLGRDRIPIDPAWIANARTATEPAPKDLRLPLIVGGAVCLLLLWFAPRGRRVATVG